VLRAFIVPAHRTQRGRLYDVRLGDFDGPLIVQRSLDPEHAACRYLVEHGLKGSLEVWSEGRTAPRMIIGCIETAAQLSASDEDRKGVRLRKYQPPPNIRATDAESAHGGVSIKGSDNDNASSLPDEKAG
jgi:hypothetical protein